MGVCPSETSYRPTPGGILNSTLTDLVHRAVSSAIPLMPCSCNIFWMKPVSQTLNKTERRDTEEVVQISRMCITEVNSSSFSLPLLTGHILIKTAILYLFNHVYITLFLTLSSVVSIFQGNIQFSYGIVHLYISSRFLTYSVTSPCRNLLKLKKKETFYNNKNRD